MAELSEDTKKAYGQVHTRAFTASGMNGVEESKVTVCIHRLISV